MVIYDVGFPARFTKLRAHATQDRFVSRAVPAASSGRAYTAYNGPSPLSIYSVSSPTGADAEIQ